MSLQVSKKRYSQCEKDGNYFEELFKSKILNLGYRFKKSTQKEDWFKHIDCYVNGYGVDVKGNRHLDTIWLEVLNVNGNKGWLQGQAYYIAMFIKELDFFSIYKRIDLLNFIKKNTTQYTETKKDYNKFYTRKKWGKKDILVKFKYNDIKHLELKQI
tara:strand:- start:78 stop:548 length:471 start_codon:yes stop_codon:yes gene_type:complete